MSKKVLILGDTGLVGSALNKILKELQKKENNYDLFIINNHHEFGNCAWRKVDLTDYKQLTYGFVKLKEKHYYLPDCVINCAGVAAGINYNIENPFEMLYQNALIQMNVVKACMGFGIKYLINLGSSCIYPKEAPVPFNEDDLFNGKFEETNKFYSFGKTAGLYAVEAARKKGFNYITLMPPNVYGVNDRFDNRSHLIPDLLKKFHQIKKLKQKGIFTSRIELQGNVDTKREFIYAEDLANIIAMFVCLNLDFTNLPEIINVGNGQEYTVFAIEEMIQKVIGTNVDVKFTGKNTGINRKILDCAKFIEIWQNLQIEQMNNFSFNSNIQKNIKEIYEKNIENIEKNLNL